MPRVLLAAIALSAAIYVSAFPLDHVPTGLETGDEGREDLWNAIWDVQLAAPFALGVLLAIARPRATTVLALVVVLAAVPLGFDWVERTAHWYPNGVSEADYGQSGMDHLTTGFLSVLAVPAGVLTGVAVVLVRLARRPG